MNFLEKTRVLQRVDQLIRMKATGSAEDLAGRLNISRSGVYNVIELIKNLGADVSYCSVRKSYYYTSNKVLAIGFVDPGQVRGGKSNFLYGLWDKDGNVNPGFDC